MSSGTHYFKASFRSKQIGEVPDRGGRIVLDAETHTRKSEIGIVWIGDRSKRKGKRAMNGSSMEREKTSRVNEGAKGNKEFSEAQKVISVFGSEMDKSNVVRASNTNKRM